MENNPTNDEMSVKRSKNGIDLAKAFKQDAPYHYMNNLEQGKPLELKKAAAFMAFVAIVIIGFIMAYLIGHYTAKAHYDELQRQYDSIAYQTALTDIKNGNYGK